MKRNVFAAMCGVLVVSAVPGFAQTDTASDRQRSYSAMNVARVYVASSSEDREHVELATNLTVTSLYRPIIERMLRLSPTFRRQCARLARAQGLTIEVRAEPTQRRLAANAWTSILRRSAHQLHAVVTVAPVGRPVELIAHEFEHIIEQLDGVDLQDLARLPTSGVRECQCDDLAAYETTRAINTGVRVAEEVGERRP